MHDITNRTHLHQLVHHFYALLAQDELLKDIFITRLGSGDWSVHLERIIDFWDTVLFASTAYKGQSFLPHATMNLEQHHFDKWLLHFNASVDELFAGAKANEAKQRAATMATLFMSKINYYRTSGAQPLM